MAHTEQFSVHIFEAVAETSKNPNEPISTFSPLRTAFVRNTFGFRNLESGNGGF